MGRSGYSDECDRAELALWRGAVKSSIRGRRGQAFLKELLEVLDAMPEKRLIMGELEADGEVCVLGAMGRARGLDISDVDVYNRPAIASMFGIAEALAAELMFQNDDDFCYRHEQTPEQRWRRVHAWVDRQIREPGVDV